MNSPIVSIVLPTFNRMGTLNEAINCVLYQSYKDFELIVSDDGSTDGTDSLVQRIDDSRVHYIRSETHRGANSARNAGIRASKGDFVAFQDSDDKWHLNKLKLQMDALQAAGADGNVCFCGMIRNMKSKTVYIPKKKRKIKDGLLDLEMELLKGNFIGTPTLVVKKRLLYEIGMFDETLQKLQDWDLVIRLSKHSKFLFINEPLVTADVYNSGITATAPSCTYIEKILCKYERDFNRNPTALFIQYINLSLSHIRSRAYATAGRYLTRSLFLILRNPFLLFR